MMGNLIIFICLAYLSGVLVDDREGRVYPHGRRFRETSTQRIVTTVFRITNMGSVQREFLSEIAPVYTSSVRRFHQIPLNVNLREDTEKDRGTLSEEKDE